MHRSTFVFALTFVCVLLASPALLFAAGAAEGAQIPEAGRQSLMVLTDDSRQAIANALADFFLTEHAAAPNGVKFIVPFFTSGCWAIGNFSLPGPVLESAGFCVDSLTPGDFFRENKDGTVTVHINSNRASAEYAEDLFNPDATVLTGAPAHLRANYTGAVIEIPLPDGTSLKFVDLNSGFNRALSIHGNGRVYGENGAAFKLSVTIVETPSGNRKSEFRLK